jgi:hypothetical protein
MMWAQVMKRSDQFSSCSFGKKCGFIQIPDFLIWLRFVGVWETEIAGRILGTPIFGQLPKTSKMLVGADTISFIRRPMDWLRPREFGLFAFWAATYGGKPGDCCNRRRV